MGPGQRRRLLRGVNAASRSLDWLLGVQQRILCLAKRWVDVDSAVHEREASTELLRWRSGYVPAASSSIVSHEYSRVSLSEDLLTPDGFFVEPPLCTLCECQPLEQTAQSQDERPGECPGPPLVLGLTGSTENVIVHCMYVEDAGIVTNEPGRAERATEEARCNLEADRWVLHELDVHTGGGQALVWNIMCESISTSHRCTVRLSSCWRSWARGIKGVSCDENSSLSFIRCTVSLLSCNHSFERLGDTVREELETLVRAMVFVVSE